MKERAMRQLPYLKNGETLALDTQACVGCGACIEVCPHAVFSIVNKKAMIANRQYCMECGACALNCPVAAIAVKAGVGCASAIIIGKLTGREPSCGAAACCGDGARCCGGGSEKCC